MGLLLSILAKWIPYLICPSTDHLWQSYPPEDPVLAEVKNTLNMTGSLTWEAEENLRMPNFMLGIPAIVKKKPVIKVTAGGGKELKSKRPPLQAYILNRV